MSKVNNQKVKLSNNIIALLTVVFIIISGFSNYFVYKKATIGVVGQASATGIIELCINAQPTLSVSHCNTSASVDYEYYCDINATDPEGANISWADNTNLFDISQNGTINFTPTLADIATYNIIITVNDLVGCSNSQNSDSFSLKVTNCIEPGWANFRNSISTNLSNYTCWDEVELLRLGLPGYAWIQYYTDSDINDYDLDRNINLTPGRITFNTTALSNINKTANITFFNLTMGNPQIFADGRYCPVDICDPNSYAYSGNLSYMGNLTSYVYHLANFHLVEGAKLRLWDDTDNDSRYNNQTMSFYVNYTYSNHTLIENGTCYIKFNNTGNWTDYYTMDYDSNTTWHNYSGVFAPQGNYSWRVNCSMTDYYSITEMDWFNISNRAPVFTTNIPELVWLEDKSYTGLDLDDYFVEPDGDPINYSNSEVSNILVDIDRNSHIVTLTPDRDFYGERALIFTATDPYNLSATSNIVNLVVIDVYDGGSGGEEGAGGGGGGGGTTAYNLDLCEELWQCSSWSKCLPEGFRRRSCVDLTECNTTSNKPNETEACNYLPSCEDNLKNGAEVGVDCGGPCPPCPTCTDGIQNQAEEGVDCGGPCLPCDLLFSRLVYTHYLDGEYNIYNLDNRQQTTNIILEGGSTEPWARLSPDGLRVVFVKDYSILITDKLRNTPRTLVTYNQDTVITGLAATQNEVFYSIIQDGETHLMRIDLTDYSRTEIDVDVPVYHVDTREGMIVFSTGYYHPHMVVETESDLEITGMATVAVESEVYIMNADGSDLSVVKTRRSAIAPRLSPDGRKIVYFSEPPNSEIWVLDLDTGENRKLTDNEYEDIFPAWVSNGEKIVFASKRGANYDLYTLYPNGREEFKVAQYGDTLYTDWHKTPTCDDSVQNQGEEGVDCGGPCLSCDAKRPRLELPEALKRTRFNWLGWTITVIIILVPLLVIFRKPLKKAAKKTKKKMDELLSKFKTRETPTIENIYIHILQRLIELKGEIGKKPGQDIVDQVNSLMRGFMVSIFKIDYGFTLEELKKEIESHKMSENSTRLLVNFYNSLEGIRFQKEELSNATLSRLIDNAQGVVESIITKDFHQTKVIALGKTRMSLNEIRKLISDGKNERAKELYKVLLQEYNLLGEAEKSQVYADITKIHVELTKKEAK